MKDEKWYWPIRLLKSLARLPIASDTWLGFGHTLEHEEDFAKDTKPVSYTHLDVYKRQVYVRFIDIEASYREQD